MLYKIKLEQLHKETKEGIVSDYVIWQSIKKMFNASNMTFYQFGLLKQVIMDFLKKQRIR